jgi:hypothetical protein
MLGTEDYFLGWIIQPLNMQDNLFYIYERDDTSQQRGSIICGSRVDAYRLVESIVN